MFAFICFFLIIFKYVIKTTNCRIIKFENLKNRTRIFAENSGLKTDFNSDKPE